MKELISIEKAEVPNEPGYFCDKYGNIYHGDRPITIGFHRGRFGYVRLGSNANGKCIRKLYTAAKLMGMAWLGADEDDTICFKDGDRTNLDLDNLYIGSRGELLSSYYKFKKENGDISDKRIARLKDNNNRVYQVDPETKELMQEFNSIYAAANYFDVSIYAIQKCCWDHSRTCCHYMWCYDFDYEEIVNN